MELDRIYKIFNTDEKVEVFYDNNPIWIQDINEDKAKVGFINGDPEKDVFIKDLYERNL